MTTISALKTICQLSSTTHNKYTTHSISIVCAFQCTTLWNYGNSIIIINIICLVFILIKVNFRFAIIQDVWWCLDNECWPKEKAAYQLGAKNVIDVCRCKLERQLNVVNYFKNPEQFQNKIRFNNKPRSSRCHHWKLIVYKHPMMSHKIRAGNSHWEVYLPPIPFHW